MSKNCYNCIHKRSIPGNAHVACVNPDPKMTGFHHGVANGWFLYPYCYDPIWMEKDCSNYSPKGVVKPND